MEGNSGVFVSLICARLSGGEKSGIHYKLIRCPYHRHGAGYKLTSPLWWWEVSSGISHVPHLGACSAILYTSWLIPCGKLPPLLVPLKLHANIFFLTCNAHILAQMLTGFSVPFPSVSGPYTQMRLKGILWVQLSMSWNMSMCRWDSFAWRGEFFSVKQSRSLIF